MPEISDEDFEGALSEAGAVDVSPTEGLFGPQSMMWRISREAIVFICAGEAALLQTAHPFVAAAIDQHSNVKSDPRERFKRTFINVFDMVFGSRAEALEKARHVRRVHDHINGTLAGSIGPFEAGTPYTAHDREAVEWVHATLAHSALRAYEIFHGALSPENKEAYWRESLHFAALFGLSAESMPETWNAFDARWQATLESGTLAIGPEAKSICGHLLLGKGKLKKLPDWYIALTAGFLPPELRQAYGLTFGPMDRRRAEAAVRRLRRLYPLLPEKLKFAPGYHRALARIDGKPEPDFITRGLERLWLGL